MNSYSGQIYTDRWNIDDDSRGTMRKGSCAIRISYDNNEIRTYVFAARRKEVKPTGNQLNLLPKINVVSGCLISKEDCVVALLR